MEAGYEHGQPNNATLWAQQGLERYELNNHLGNVLAVATDKKLAVDGDNNGQADYYAAEVMNAQDYYPFGMLQPGRSYTLGGAYRYGFNGKENDNEVKGEGNQQDYGMRVYDPRIGKFLSMDPITKSYPELTPYQFASNRPIDGIDQDGLEHITANYLVITNGQKTTVKLINYKLFNNEFHDVPGPKGAGVQYNISIINNDGSREQKQHFINRGAYAEYGSYYGSTPLMNLDGNGNFIPGTYNYELPAVGTVDALAKTHDQPMMQFGQ